MDPSITDLLDSLAPFPPKEEGFFEVVERRLVVKPFWVTEAEIASELLGLLGPYARENGLGKVEVLMLYLLDPARALMRRPDVSFVSAERWPIRKRAPRAEVWDVVPDLAVEVVGPSRSEADLATRIEEYFAAGVRLVWAIFPLRDMARVYRSPSSRDDLRRDDTLDGGDVLPGFRLPLATLFEGEPEATAPPA
jgi:Uma2 family endonuclease